MVSYSIASAFRASPCSSEEMRYEPSSLLKPRGIPSSAPFPRANNGPRKQQFRSSTPTLRSSFLPSPLNPKLTSRKYSSSAPSSAPSGNPTSSAGSSHFDAIGRGKQQSETLQRRRPYSGGGLTSFHKPPERRTMTASRRQSPSPYTGLNRTFEIFDRCCGSTSTRSHDEVNQLYSQLPRSISSRSVVSSSRGFSCESGNSGSEVFRTRTSQGMINLNRTNLPQILGVPQIQLLDGLERSKVKVFSPERLFRGFSRSTNASHATPTTFSGSNQRPAVPEHSVHLRVYDITEGAARTLSEMFLCKPVNGVWHSGIVAYGFEYFYCSGILRMRPADVEAHFSMKLTTTHYLGQTARTRKEFEKFLLDCHHLFSSETYDILEWNCNDFTNLCGLWLFNGQTDSPRKLRLDVQPEEITSYETRYDKMKLLLDIPGSLTYEARVIPNYLLEQREALSKIPAGGFVLYCVRAAQTTNVFVKLENAIKANPFVVACGNAAGRLKENLAGALAEQRVRSSRSPWCC